MISFLKLNSVTESNNCLIEAEERKLQNSIFVIWDLLLTLYSLVLTPGTFSNHRGVFKPLLIVYGGKFMESLF